MRLPVNGGILALRVSVPAGADRQWWRPVGEYLAARCGQGVQLVAHPGDNPVVTIRAPKNETPQAPERAQPQRTATTPAPARPESPARTGLRRWEVRDVPGRVTGASSGFESARPSNAARAN